MTLSGPPKAWDTVVGLDPVPLRMVTASKLRTEAERRVLWFPPDVGAVKVLVHTPVIGGHTRIQSQDAGRAGKDWLFLRKIVWS